MKLSRAVLLVAFLAIPAHLLLGWLGVIPAAAVGAGMASKRAPLAGLAGGALAFGLLVLYNFVVALEPTVEMSRVVGSLAGGLPGWSIVVLTLLAGGVLGAAGGWIGGTFRNIIR